MNGLKEKVTNDLLRMFRDKARCAHTQSQATSIYHALRERLPSGELGRLGVAWGHATGPNADPRELDGLVARMIADRTLQAVVKARRS